MNDSADPRTAESEWLDRLYARLADDSDGRACAALSDAACRESPGNFLKTLVAQALTNFGDRVASAKTTLPWLLAAVGAPAWCSSLLVPLRESGSMLPQLLIGAWARGLAIRKWLWVWGSLVQGASLAAMAWTAVSLTGVAAGLVILTLLALFAVARGMCSVASKDVLGKTIAKGRRGRLSGWVGAISGFAALLTGVVLALADFGQGLGVYAGMLVGGAVLWGLAAWVYASIVEFPGENEGPVRGLATAWSSLGLLRHDAPFRRFVIARALAMGSGLAAPLYILLARDDLGPAALYLGVFIAVEGLSNMLSAPLWGRWADRSSRMVFAGSCLLSALMSLGVAAWSLAALPSSWALWFYPAAFFVLGIAHAGVRLGRKTYLVDMAEGNQRTSYVAVSNTVIGALLLVSGGVAALAAVFSVPGAIALLAAAGLLGAFMSWRLPEVSLASQ